MWFLIHKIIVEIISWGIWLIIPVGWEFLKAIISSVIIIVKKLKNKKKELEYFPMVTILVPVYNSRNTLNLCLQSIVDQNYPLEMIEVFLIDNGSKESSYDIFENFQNKNSKLKVWWYYSKNGKSKALNKGIFTGHGKYIINIDSDGWLDKNAIKNVVTKFESDDKIACMTGVILTDINLIEKTKNKVLRLIQRCELFEYNEAFLVGRNFQSTFNQMYTLAGAFSCFKREVLMKTQMYNSETLGEDTHMTFQIRKFDGGKIVLCEDAFFYVDPIENLDRLYTQRQRWQRSEIEIAKMFSEYYTNKVSDVVTKFTMRILISDHTLAFSKLLWFFAMIYLYFINYSWIFLIGGNIILYLIYSLNSLIYLNVSKLYLKEQPELKKYINKKWYICFLMPFYRTITFFIRIAGIINSMKSESKWHTKSLSQELKDIKNFLKSSLHIK